MRNILEEHKMVRQMSDEALDARLATPGPNGEGSFLLLSEKQRRNDARAQARMPESGTTVREDLMRQSAQAGLPTQQVPQQVAPMQGPQRGFSFGGLIQDHWMDGFGGVPGLQAVITQNTNAADEGQALGLRRYRAQIEPEEDRKYALGGQVMPMRTSTNYIPPPVGPVAGYQSYGGGLISDEDLRKLQEEQARRAEREEVLAQVVADRPQATVNDALTNLLDSEIYRRSIQPLHLGRVEPRLVEAPDLSEYKDLVQTEIEIGDYDTDKIDRAVVLANLARGLGSEENFVTGLSKGTAAGAEYQSGMSATRDAQRAQAAKELIDRKSRMLELGVTTTASTNQANAAARDKADAVNISLRNAEIAAGGDALDRQIALMKAEQEAAELQERTDREQAKIRFKYAQLGEQIGMKERQLQEAIANNVSKEQLDFLKFNLAQLKQEQDFYIDQGGLDVDYINAATRRYGIDRGYETKNRAIDVREKDIDYRYETDTEGNRIREKNVDYRYETDTEGNRIREKSVDRNYDARTAETTRKTRRDEGDLANTARDITRKETRDEGNFVLGSRREDTREEATEISGRDQESRADYRDRLADISDRTLGLKEELGRGQLAARAATNQTKRDLGFAGLALEGEALLSQDRFRQGRLENERAGQRLATKKARQKAIADNEALKIRRMDAESRSVMANLEARQLEAILEGKTEDPRIVVQQMRNAARQLQVNSLQERAALKIAAEIVGNDFLLNVSPDKAMARISEVYEELREGFTTNDYIEYGGEPRVSRRPRTGVGTPSSRREEVYGPSQAARPQPQPLFVEGPDGFLRPRQ